LKHDLVKASTKTFSGKNGAAWKNQEMKRTEMVALKFFIELDKVWPEEHALLVLTARH